MFPHAPTNLRGDLQIGGVDQQVQGRYVYRARKPFGVWYDDTTPDLEHWLQLGVTKYAPLDQQVFVCIPPGHAGQRHRPSPPVVNVYEAYIYGMGVEPDEWLPLPAYEAYVCQWIWPGTHGQEPPSPAERERLLELVEQHHPRYVWLF